MKRIVLFITAVLLFAGCAKEQLVEERSYTGPVTVIEATFESLNNGATKADVTDAGIFTWQNGDKAAFTAASGSSYYTGTNSSTTATAVFSINDSPSFTSSSFAFYPSDLTSGTETSSLAVKVPVTREWVEDQTNVAMYGAKVENEASFNFSHMGGLVRVRVNNVPTNARKFVFKTPDYKISGDFTAVEESGFKVIKTKKHETENPVPESEQTYTLYWETAPNAENTMDFYIPLPLGTYANGFAFKFLDGTDAEILSKTSSQSETIARKDLVLMPAITLMGGEIETAEKAAVVANIPAGYSGDFLLPQSEKVLLKINASSVNHDITLKYDGANNIPTNLEVKVVDGDNAGNYNAKLLGNLPYTHVKFTQGNIDHTELITSPTTLAVIYPATIGTLTVKGGNVVLQGATVNMIEVAEGAVADASTGDPVEIKMEKYTPTVTGSTEQTPKVTGSVVAEANVKVAPVEGQTVTVVKVGSVTVADTGEGNVEEKENVVSVSTFEDFENAVGNVVAGQTIKVTANISDAQGITVAEGKNFTVDFGGHTYTCESNPAGSTGTKNQVFQLLQNSTITFKNGTIDVAEAAKENFRFIIQNYADLTLEDVTIDGTGLSYNTDGKNYTYALSNNCGTVNLNGTTSIKASTTSGMNNYAFDVCKYASYDAPTVTWNSTGSVDGTIELSGGKFVLGHNLEVKQPIKVIAPATLDLASYTLSAASGFTKQKRGVVIVNRGGNLTINGTTGVIDGSSNGVYAAVAMTEPETCDLTTNVSKKAQLTVNNGTLQGRYYGIVGNGERHNTEITVAGGTIKGVEENNCVGIYHPQSGTLTITGGNIEGSTGLVLKGGELIVNGGKINGTGTAGSFSHNGSGWNNTGDALAIEVCDYPGQNPPQANLSVTINGGQFTSTSGNAVASYAQDTNHTALTGFIHGGTFSDESAIKYAAQNANINIALQADRDASGIFLGQNKNVKVTFDLGGKTLNFVAPAVGSKGTENQAFHIEQGNQLFTLKNGKVTIDESAKTAFRFIIQNYNDLTVHNVELDGSNLGFADKTRYTVSNNQGTVNFTGSTSIKAASTNDIAFDVCKYASYDAPTVTWASTTGSVDGIIELTGGTLSLEEDLCINAPIFVKTNNQSTLELNGKKVYNISNIWETDSAKKWFELIKVDGGKLEINGTSNGSVAAKPYDCYAVNVINEGVLEINGGTFKGNVSAVQVDKGTATINAGSFEQQQGTQYDKYLLNCVDANYKAKTANIIVKGGSFTRFNPADNAAEGAGTNFVASGYTSTETSTGVWTVSATQN